MNLPRTKTVIALPVNLDKEVNGAIANLATAGHPVTQISQPVSTVQHPAKLVVMLVYRVDVATD